VLSFFFVLLS